MARDKQAMQDNAMWAMDKINRENPTTARKEPTMAEMLAEDRKPADQKRRELPKHVWTRELQDFITMDKHGPGNRLVSYVNAKYKADIEAFRTSGAPYSDVTKFIRSKSEELLNL